MTSHDYTAVKEGLLIEGLRDAIALGEIHGDFYGQDAALAPPIAEVQNDTLALVRHLVNEGLAVLGVPDRRGEFESWDIPLNAAMTKIEDAYIRNYSDRRNWTHIVWLSLTDKGEKLADELYRAD